MKIYVRAMIDRLRRSNYSSLKRRETCVMPDYSDLINFVRGPLPEKPLPCIWDFFPCHAGAIGDVPNFLEYYFDVDEKLRLQQKLQGLSSSRKSLK